jgi:hypothetical protein
MRDRSTTTDNSNTTSRGSAPRSGRGVPASRHGFRVARPSREAIVGRPSEPSSLSASLRPFGLAGLTAPHGRLGAALA